LEEYSFVPILNKIVVTQKIEQMNRSELLFFTYVKCELFPLFEGKFTKKNHTFFYKDLYEENTFGYSKKKVNTDLYTPLQGAKKIRDMFLKDESLKRYTLQCAPQAYVYIGATDLSPSVEIYFGAYETDSSEDKYLILLRIGRGQKFTALIEGRDRVTTFDTIMKGFERRVNGAFATLMDGVK